MNTFVWIYKKEKFNSIKDLLKEEILLQQKPSVTRTNFDKFIKENNLETNIKMEVVSHNLLVNLIENSFGIGLVTKEFVHDKINKTRLHKRWTNDKCRTKRSCT